MAEAIKVAVIGLDTSHSIEFTRRMQAPDCPPELRVPGLRAVACLRFETPFQNQAGLDARQRTLESWGVRVTEDFAEAVSGCEAIMLEINDPARHLEYFRKCADLGRPVFVDKPLADTLAAGREIAALAAARGVPVMSGSSLRHVPALLDACATVPAPLQASLFGPLGKAPAGSSIVWYGVHAFEMLERAMGRGAAAVTTLPDRAGVVCVVDYGDARRGVVELSEGNYAYGGALRGADKAAAFVVDMSLAYTLQLAEIAKFFRTRAAPVDIADAVEVTGMLDAAQRSFDAGRPARVNAPVN